MNKGSEIVSKMKQKSRWILALALVASLSFHMISYVNLNFIANQFRTLPTVMGNNEVKIKLVTKNDINAAEKKSKREAQKIIEVQQRTTERPQDAKLSSFQDHKAEKQTRRETKFNERAKNAGAKGMKKDHELTQVDQKSLQQNSMKKTKSSAEKKPKLEIADGQLAFSAQDRRKREMYKRLMPSSNDLAGLVDAGYQSHLDEEIDLGDHVDLNTSEYRYMGYFTNMRKSIELVWNYPAEASRSGMQGEVGIEFVINKNGSVSRIKIVRSSGYKILDDAIVEALQLASPFAPLPDGFGKEKMLVTGSFRYILSSYIAGAH